MSNSSAVVRQRDLPRGARVAPGCGLAGAADLATAGFAAPAAAGCDCAGCGWASRARRPPLDRSSLTLRRSRGLFEGRDQPADRVFRRAKALQYSGHLQRQAKYINPAIRLDRNFGDAVSSSGSIVNLFLSFRQRGGISPQRSRGAQRNSNKTIRRVTAGVLVIPCRSPICCA